MEKIVKKDTFYTEDIDKFSKRLLFNKKKIGLLQLSEDGHWYYIFDTNNQGLYSQNTLLEISKVLEELNKDFDSILQDYFDNQSEKLDDEEDIDLWEEEL